MHHQYISREHVSIPVSDLQEFVKTSEERMTILHCRLFIPEPSFIGIWPEALLCPDLGEPAKLISAEGIVLMPESQYEDEVGSYKDFTLLFEGLPAEATRFRMEERITEPGAFFSPWIARNRMDIYVTGLFSR